MMLVCLTCQTDLLTKSFRRLTWNNDGGPRKVPGT